MICKIRFLDYLSITYNYFLEFFQLILRLLFWASVYNVNINVVIVFEVFDE